MKTHIFLILVMLLAAGILPMTAGATPNHAQSCSYPMTMTDATNTEITIQEEPTRVVTLNPSATQTMWEIGAKEKVVGLTQYGTYLEGAEEQPLVSSDEQIIVLEKIVELEPDLVLAPNVVSNETVEKLRELGLTVYYFPPAETIEDVSEKTQLIGRLVGECEGAANTVQWMQSRIDVVEEAVTGQERPDVLYLFFGYTAGENTFINEIIETAGGNNIATDVGIALYEQISPEVVIDQDPDWIILNTNDPAIPNEPAFNQTTAVQNDRVIVIEIEHLNQPAPRVVLAVTELAKAFHPDAYAEANATATRNQSITATSTSTTPHSTTTPAPEDQVPTPTPTTTPIASPGQPGFGFLLAALTLLFTTILSVVRRVRARKKY